MDSIRDFDPESQRSRRKMESVFFSPASEVVLAASPPASDLLREDHQELILRNIYFDGGVLYPSLFGSTANPLADGVFSTLIIADAERVKQTWINTGKATLEWFGKKKFPSPEGLFHNIYAELPENISLAAKTVELHSFSVPRGKGRNLPIKMLPPLPLDLGEIAKILKKESAAGPVAIISRYRKRLEHYLSDEGLESVMVFEGAARGGFRLDDVPLCVFTDAEMFQRRAEPKVVIKRERDRLPIIAPADIEVGDYIVHIDHGVGKYKGIITQTSPEGVTRDFFSISYARGDSLFVPIEQIERIEKYIGAEGTPPKLYPLHSTRWNAVKTRIRQHVEDMAETLYALYTEREQAKGFSFSPDNLFMQELEDSFNYEETEDQVVSIERVKKDMERMRPMDHLVYGDVGFGKTEVALRAAFKATLDKKQVALLAPTTILTQQHGRTFRERFSRFPVTVEVLNRFRSPKETKALLKRLAAGEIDIVIGTHALLQEKVKFKDLGLLIVDEEQRFGVKHKERLKMMKLNVDVLTLTATPIPRTLHMSMIGLRDMSLIETPPEDRKAVKTFVEEWNMSSLYTAVERELARSGQIFFVHNDIATIDQIKGFIQNSFPDIRIGVCHGKMHTTDIENTMDAFMDGQFDMLLSTTIIENGLDIPNVNTLIVNAAENFGLSQLYQLRGRVGRSFRQSYAYLFYSPYKALTEKAQKRLEALRDFADLGSGYRLAMKDLEIRGAGNLLGKEQHGFIAEVGFNLYCRMLAESVEKVRGTPLEIVPQVEVDLAVNAFIPEDYVPDTPARTEFYKKFVSCSDTVRVDRITEEMADRFGALPQPARTFISMVKIKILARAAGVEKLKTHPHSELTDMTFRDPAVYEEIKRMPYPGDFTLEVVYLKDRVRFMHEGVRPARVVENIYSFLLDMVCESEKNNGSDEE